MLQMFLFLFLRFSYLSFLVKRVLFFDYLVRILLLFWPEKQTQWSFTDEILKRLDMHSSNYEGKQHYNQLTGNTFVKKKKQKQNK